MIDFLIGSKKSLDLVTFPKQAQYYKIDKRMQVRVLSANGGRRSALGKHICQTTIL